MKYKTLLVLAVALILRATSYPAEAQQLTTHGVQRDLGEFPSRSGNDPAAQVGGCFSSDSGFHSRIGFIEEAGRTLANVTAVAVLDCHGFDGPGGTFIAPCPISTVFSFCTLNENDGFGNHVYLGVLQLTPATEPNTQYGGCAEGAGFRSKASLLADLGIDQRTIDNLVVIDCHAADGPPGTVVEACPGGSKFYSKCIINEDDGVGNHIEVGVITTHGAGDPYAQYGGCNSGSAFRSKSLLVTEAGKSLDNVTSIVVTGCAHVNGLPGTRIVPCASFDTQYSYCVANDDDGIGNQVFAGVITRP